MQSADLDVVVDLMTHTRGARLELASESVAPSGSALMVSYLGYPGVAGGVHWDYTLADSIVLPPEHAKGIEEPLIYLPFSYQANDYAPSSPAILEEDFVPLIRYCNINQVDKYEPVSWGLWMNILRKTPGSTLALYRMRDPLGAHVVRHLSEEAEAEVFTRNASSGSSVSQGSSTPSGSRRSATCSWTTCCTGRTRRGRRAVGGRAFAHY